MEEKESKLPAPFGMDAGRRKKENERLITRKMKRKGTPRRLVSKENISASESFQQRPTENFSSQDILDMARKGRNFLSCLIIANAGEDIIAKITSFCENCSCNAYIVSAVGSIARASIVQCGNASTYEGLYGIMSLTGHVSVSLTPGCSKGYKVAISLVGNNGSVFAGDVSGPLIAATDVQILMRKSSHSPSEETSGQGSSSTVGTQRDKNEDSLNIPKEMRS
ncbi:hypothetical protein DITRI_Ditri12bG0099300 [Diplodiscus trichospermus]